MSPSPYRRLLVMALLSFVAMFGLMYMMVDRIQNVLPNINQFYMAGMMTAAMIVLELAVMGAMYPNKQTNGRIMAASAAIAALLIVAIRMQVLVGDAQLLRSMIPHHAGAILMCEQAQLQDPAVEELCDSILAAQKAEIDWIRTKLENP